MSEERGRVEVGEAGWRKERQVGREEAGCREKGQGKELLNKYTHIFPVYGNTVNEM